MYSVTILASRLASLITLPLITRALKPSDFGVLEMVSTTFMVAEIVLSGNFADAFTYFYNAALKQGEAQARRVVQTSLIGALILGVVGFLLGLVSCRVLSVWALGSPRYASLFLISFVGFLGSLPFSLGANYLRAADKALHCVGLGILRLVIQTGLCVLLLVGMKMGIEGVMLSGTITVLLCATLCCVYLFARFGFGFDPRNFVAQLKYSFPLALSGLGTLFSHYGDRYYLQRHTSLADIGVYSLAYRIGMLVSMVHGPFLFYWLGDVYRISDLDNGKAVVVRVFRYVTLCLVAAGVALALFTRPMLTILATPAYYGAAAFAPWLLLAYIARGMSDQIRTVFSTRARTWEYTLVTLITVITALVAYGTLIPRYGVAGAVASTVLIFVVTLLVSLWRAQAVDRHNFEWSRILLMFVISFGVVGLEAYLHPSGLRAQLGFGAAGTLLWCLMVWHTGVITREERQTIGSMIRKSLGRPVQPAGLEL